MTELIREIIIPLTGAIAVFYAIKKTNVDVLVSKISVLKDQCGMTEKLVESCENDKHSLIIEKIFKSIFRKTLSANEIKHLINYPNPSEIIRKYCASKKYLTIDSNEKKIQFKEPYKKPIKRKLYRAGYMVGYLFWFIGALSPYIFNKQLNLLSHGVIGVLIAVFFFFSFGFMAFWAVKDGLNLNTAEELQKLSKI